MHDVISCRPILYSICAKFTDVFILTEERKLSELECPLLVQLNWGKDDREGRFLLKREIDKTTAVCFHLLPFYNMQMMAELLWYMWYISVCKFVDARLCYYMR